MVFLAATTLLCEPCRRFNGDRGEPSELLGDATEPVFEIVLRNNDELNLFQTFFGVPSLSGVVGVISQPLQASVTVFTLLVFSNNSAKRVKRVRGGLVLLTLDAEAR